MYFLYISPAIADIQGLIAKKDEYNNVLNRAEDLKQKRDEIFAQYNSIDSTDLDKLNKIVPEKFNSTEFANDLNMIAQRNGLAITSVRESSSGSSQGAVTAETERTPYVKNAMNLLITGPYQSLENFLREVESSLQLIDISAITFAQSKDKDGNTFQYNLDINVYSLR